MPSLSRLTSPLAVAGEWLEEHTLAYFLALVATSVVARVLFATVTNEGLREAAVSGVIFGIAFATAMLAFRRYLGGPAN